MSARFVSSQAIRRLSAGAGAVLVASFLPLVAASPAAAAGPALAWDFNGDGHRDFAVGVSGENDQAGSIAVFRGTSSGLSTSGVLRISQDTPGVPGTAEPRDHFGAALASGDFDGDGY